MSAYNIFLKEEWNSILLLSLLSSREKQLVQKQPTSPCYYKDIYKLMIIHTNTNIQWTIHPKKKTKIVVLIKASMLLLTIIHKKKHHYLLPCVMLLLLLLFLCCGQRATTPHWLVTLSNNQRTLTPLLLLLLQFTIMSITWDNCTNWRLE